jgi:hypothetical protein
MLPGRMNILISSVENGWLMSMLVGGNLDGSYVYNDDADLAVGLTQQIAARERPETSAVEILIGPEGKPGPAKPPARKR